MYYNEITQPDGTPIIGINYEEERPPALEVIPNTETQHVQQQEPEYELFNSVMIAWLNVFLVALSVHYTILYDNILTIINCLACNLIMTNRV